MLDALGRYRRRFTVMGNCFPVNSVKTNVL